MDSNDNSRISDLGLSPREREPAEFRNRTSSMRSLTDAVVLALLVVLVSACGGGGDEKPSPTNTVAATSTQTSTGVATLPSSATEAVALPSGALEAIQGYMQQHVPAQWPLKSACKDVPEGAEPQFCYSAPAWDGTTLVVPIGYPFDGGAFVATLTQDASGRWQVVSFADAPRTT